MEKGLEPSSSNINTPAFYSAIPNPQLPNSHAVHEENDPSDDSPEIPLASTGSSSPNYEGAPSSTNSQASMVSRYTRDDEYNLVTLPVPGHAFIVQMPRDQIFRVPPPENDHIVKRFRQPLAKKRSTRNFKACLPLLYALVVLLAVLVLGIFILQLFLKPQNPEFTVKNLVFKNLTRPEYDISLIAKNHDQSLFNIIYEGAEDASLLYERKTLAEGSIPAFEQGHNAATNVMISFSSLKKNSLPVDLENNLKGKKKKTPLEFSMVMEMPIRSKLFVIPAPRSRNMFIKCEFTVDSLAARNKIVAQKCRTNVQ